MAYLTDEMFIFGPSEQRLRYPSVLGRATFCLELVIIIIVTFVLKIKHKQHFNWIHFVSLVYTYFAYLQKDPGISVVI